MGYAVGFLYNRILTDVLVLHAACTCMAMLTMAMLTMAILTMAILTMAVQVLGTFFLWIGWCGVNSDPTPTLPLRP